MVVMQFSSHILPGSPAYRLNISEVTPPWHRMTSGVDRLILESFTSFTEYASWLRHPPCHAETSSGVCRRIATSICPRSPSGRIRTTTSMTASPTRSPRPTVSMIHRSICRTSLRCCMCTRASMAGLGSASSRYACVLATSSTRSGTAGSSSTRRTPSPPGNWRPTWPSHVCLATGSLPCPPAEPSPMLSRCTPGMRSASPSERQRPTSRCPNGTSERRSGRANWGMPSCPPNGRSASTGGG